MVSRRRFLRSIGVAGLGGVAGCNALPFGSGATGAEPALVKSNAVSAEWSDFGEAVALGDGILVVGAKRATARAAHRTGAAFLYERAGASWVKQARLRPHPEDTAGPFDESQLSFGSSVAVEDQTVVVGSHTSGSLYTFERVDGEWTRTTSLYPTGSRGDRSHLLSMDFDGEALAVSTLPGRHTDKRDEEAVHVYQRDGREWSRTARLTRDPAPLRHDRFGQSVAVDGDTLAAVSATDDSDNGPHLSVHVYHRNADGWEQQTVLEPSKPPDYPLFTGFNTIALRGDTLAVGGLVAETGDDEDTPDRGRVNVYERIGGGWMPTSSLGPERFRDDWQFGAPLALTDGGLVVGSENHGVGGTARYYEKDGRDWARARVLDESDAIRDGRFGQAVAATENHVAVSGRIRREDVTDRPVVYVFDR